MLNNLKLLLFFIFLVFFSGCGDPPLLRTSLPNGYSFHSNGGGFGYIQDPNGRRMSEYFGIISDEKEQ